MKGDEKVIEYLNKALTNELTAINQYWLHYRVLDNWGLHKLAEYERRRRHAATTHAADDVPMRSVAHRCSPSATTSSASSRVSASPSSWSTAAAMSTISRSV